LTITQYCPPATQLVASLASTVIDSGIQFALAEDANDVMEHDVLEKPAGATRPTYRSAVDPGSIVSSTLKAYGWLLLKVNQWQRPAPRLAANCCGR
jgi:hypothetical protein